MELSVLFFYNYALQKFLKLNAKEYIFALFLEKGSRRGEVKKWKEKTTENISHGYDYGTSCFTPSHFNCPVRAPLICT